MGDGLGEGFWVMAWVRARVRARWYGNYSSLEVARVKRRANVQVAHRCMYTDAHIYPMYAYTYIHACMHTHTLRS